LKNAKGFRYELQPVLLTRQWTLDQLFLELKQINGDLQRLQLACKELGEQSIKVGKEWRARSEGSQHIDVAAMTVMRCYMQDLSVQHASKQKELDDTQVQRNLLIDRIAAAKRAVEAIEAHKEKMQVAFDRVSVSNDFKISDDQWSNLQSYKAQYDNAT
jgi:hypothetical protein